MLIVVISAFKLLTEAQFGLKSTYCIIEEHEADIEVCVEQKSPPNGCPVAFQFDLILDVQSHTAG